MRTRLLLALPLVFVAAGGRADSRSQAPAAAASKTLRVCADPAGLPYSNERKEGFENRIAELVAKELGVRLEYTWWAQRRGFLRSTLNAGACDVVIGAPVGLEMLRTTRPYYRSTFAFVTKKGARLGDLRSIDDPRLRALRIGVPLAGDDGANPAPVHALGKRDLTGNLRGYPLYGELGRTLPVAAEAVANGDIDLAVLWGPIAGGAVKRSPVPLVATPLAEESDGPTPFAFSIAMGVRKRDAALAASLDDVLAKRKDAITVILRDAGVPLLAIAPSVPAHGEELRDGSY